MESLRWILLAAGIAFIVFIYLLGRSRRQRNSSMVDALEEAGEDELPEFSARSLDDMDEGVGQVRVVTATSSIENEDEAMPLNVSTDTDSLQSVAKSSAPKNSERQEDAREEPGLGDIIVLYILPKPDAILIGSQINSSAQAMGLKFGEMNIFHYMDEGRSVFSLANMLEPGSFNAETMHDLKTTGLTIFMQIQREDPLDDLTEMLQRSYQLAGLLDARLCNHKREPLTEQDAENYRTHVNGFVAPKTSATSSELSSET